MVTEEATGSIETLSFEQALAELETIVRNLEQGNVPLEKSIELYSRGEALREKCDGLLKAAEEKVEKIQMNSAGAAVATEPLGD
ncbi:exodeoxyribonuclease VII small subunit [Pseudovibrio sp. Tun.PSC04-5.I4]|uniref:exodeoxyribonuclease VII small subunit n=1 Tax=Pseudovibrio sp. Tun.PSC04-5.I4 TaxID=1798213 RepID=UPI000B82DF4A|nr:exodeoxyribonuclease VII small subunit [Pseudovibrio sp. Tun.PSC04-5.I4]